MGFGSYDESEQEHQNRSNDDDAEGVTIDREEHEVVHETGSVSEMLDSYHENVKEEAEEE